MLGLADTYFGAFGILTIAQGFIHTWGQLAILRVFLGVFEGALLPATLFCTLSTIGTACAHCTDSG